MKLFEISGKRLSFKALVRELGDAGKLSKDLSDYHLDGVVDFRATATEVHSLEGFPQSVGGYFNCSDQYLKTLMGAPRKVGTSRGRSGSFEVYRNDLRSLVGAPEHCSYFDCSYNHDLKTLDGGPKTVDGEYKASYCALTSLVGIAAKIDGDLILDNNKLTSLKDINKHINTLNGILDVYDNPITSNVVGVLLVAGITRASFGDSSDHPTTLEEVNDILNKYLPNTEGMKAVRACQSELVDAGFEEFAKL